MTLPHSGPMGHAVRIAVVLAVVATASGCLDDVTGTRPLSISLTSDITSATTGQDVTFTFEAQGTGLSKVTIAFGDSEFAEHTYPSSAVEAAGFSTHSYASAGVYTVVATVDASNGTLADSLSVTVN